MSIIKITATGPAQLQAVDGLRRPVIVIHGVVAAAGGVGGSSAPNPMVIYRTVVGANVNFIAIPGTAYFLPAATLTANRVIDMTALITEGDYAEFYNNETGFVWSFSGQIVYDSDGTTPITELLANTTSAIRRINGKLIISKL